MADNIKFLDPVQGLIDYVNDIKPYHTKIIESLVEYVNDEAVNATVIDHHTIEIGLDYSYNIPLNQLYYTIGGEFIVPTLIPVYSNFKVIGSPPEPVYDYNETIVYLNEILQTEITSHSLLGDYRITGPNELTFVDPLPAEGKIKIYTFTQWQSAPTTCLDGGYGTLQFGNFAVFPIVSPDPSISMIDFPAMTTNSFIILGNQLSKFGFNKNLIFNINSSTEHVITGSPPTVDSDNTGTFNITGLSSFTEGTKTVSPYTTVFINKTLTLPTVGSPIDPNEKYVSSVSTGTLTYQKVFPYSNVLTKHTIGSPSSLLSTPDEGELTTPIINGNLISPSYFVINGDFRNSNILVDDEFFVVNSSTNDGSYIILSTSYSLSGSPFLPETTFNVASITGSPIDGDIKLNIPSNVFIIDDDYTAFFKQGVGVDVLSGTAQGLYTTLNSKFVNNTTQIRVIEDIPIGSPIITGELTYTTPGFGQVPIICEIIPQTIVKIGISENIKIDILQGSPPTILKYQYVIVNTTDTSGSPFFGANSISVYGDATTNILDTNIIEIINSNGSPNNDGTYTVNSFPVFNNVGNYTTFNVSQTINTIGNSGGWVEGNII